MWIPIPDFNPNWIGTDCNEIDFGSGTTIYRYLCSTRKGSENSSYHDNLKQVKSYQEKCKFSLETPNFNGTEHWS